MKASFLLSDNEDDHLTSVESSLVIIPEFSTSPQTVSVRLTASQIYLDPVTDIRYGPVCADEDSQLRELAEDLKWQQAEPLLIRAVHEKAGFPYRIINGRRRLRAAQLYLLDYEFDCRCVLNCDDDTAYRLALSTFRRRDLTVIQILHNIQEVRKRKGWLKDTVVNGSAPQNHYIPELAHYFGFSEAKIREIERLSVLSDDVQRAIHMGEMSPEAAYLNAKVRQRDPELADRMQELAQMEAIKEKKTRTKGSGTRGSGKGRGKKTNGNQDFSDSEHSSPAGGSSNDYGAVTNTESIPPDQDPVRDGAETRRTDPDIAQTDRVTGVVEPVETVEPVKISRKHMLKAGRVLAPEHLSQERDRAEILEFFQELRSTRYPRCMARFAQWFAGEFADGKAGSGEHLQELWDGIGQEIVNLERRLDEMIGEG